MAEDSDAKLEKEVIFRQIILGVTVYINLSMTMLVVNSATPKVQPSGAETFINEL